MKKLWQLWIVLMVIFSNAVNHGLAQSQPQIDPQKVIVNPLRNDLKLQIAVDRAGNNPSYKIGEKIRVTVGVNQDAYVYVFSIHFDGQMDLIQPNNLSGGAAFMRAGETKSFPPANGGYLLQIDGPVGQDKFLGIASKRQLSIEAIASFSGKQPFATVAFNGQDNLAKGFSSVLASLESTEWVSEIAFFQVLARNSTVSTVNTGTVQITTQASAQIYLDGKLVGQGPMVVNAPAGNHEIRVKLEGFKDFVATVKVVEGRTVNLNAPLIPVPREGTLSITSTTAGAIVYVDGQQVGKTATDGTFRISGLPAGKYSVTFIARGYEMQSQPVIIEGGQISTLMFNPVSAVSSPAPTTSSAATTTTPAPASTPVMSTAPSSNSTDVSPLVGPRTNVRVLSIGINSYQESRIQKLQFAEHDAQVFADAMRDSSVGNVLPENVSVMLGANATGSRIQSKFRQLARLTKSGETLVVFFAGHGAPTPSAQPEALLVPYDTDPSDLLGTALSLRDLQAVKTDGGRVVFVLDSCFSGQAGSRSITQENTRPFGVVAKVSLGSGVTTLTATSNSDPSLESAQLGGGVFTYFLLEGLRGAADSNKDGRVTLQEAHAYALSKVRTEARKQSLNQSPELSGDSTFALGINGDRDRAASMEKRLEPLLQLRVERKVSVQQYLFLEDLVRAGNESEELKLFLEGKITAAQFLRLLPTIPGIPK